MSSSAELIRRPKSARSVVRGVLRGDDADRLQEDAGRRVGGYRLAVDALAFPRPRRTLRRMSGDVLLAALVAVLSELDVWAPLSFVGRVSHRPALALVFLAGSLALVWRRRAPLAVLAFVYTSGSLLYLA